MLFAFQTGGDSVDDAANAQLNGVAVVYAVDDELRNLCFFGRRRGHLDIFEQLFLQHKGIDGAYVVVVGVAEHTGKTWVDLRNDVLCAAQCALFESQGSNVAVALSVGRRHLDYGVVEPNFFQHAIGVREMNGNVRNAL